MIQLIILLGIISIIDFSTKKIPVVVLVVMGIVGIASSFYAKQSIISVAVALIPGIVLMAAAFLTGEQIGYGDAAVVTLIVMKLRKDKADGKSSCGCNCGCCPNSSLCRSGQKNKELNK